MGKAGGHRIWLRQTRFDLFKWGNVGENCKKLQETCQHLQSTQQSKCFKHEKQQQRWYISAELIILIDTSFSVLIA